MAMLRLSPYSLDSMQAIDVVDPEVIQKERIRNPPMDYGIEF